MIKPLCHVENYMIETVHFHSIQIYLTEQKYIQSSNDLFVLKTLNLIQTTVHLEPSTRDHFDKKPDRKNNLPHLTMDVV